MSQHKLDLFVLVGEVSGDLLAHSILTKLPSSVKIGGVLGPKLRSESYEPYFQMELFEIHGLLSLIKSLPRLIRSFKMIKQKILELNPKVVVLVDNVEFNLLLGKSLKKSGFQGKIVQLVCPTVWAWRKGRKKTMLKAFDVVLSLFPFEKELFEKSSLRVEFIGHPLVENLLQVPKRQNETTPSTIALFPGSRRSEIIYNLPLQLRAVKNYQGDYQIAISVASPSHQDLINKIVDKEGIQAVFMPGERRFELMQIATIALAKCGTIALELAVMGTPTIVTYKMNRLDLAASMLAKIYLPHYSLPNILLKRRVFPEYIALLAKEPLVEEELKNCLNNPLLRKFMKSAAEELLQLYKEKKPSDEASKIIENLIFIPS